MLFTCVLGNKYTKNFSLPLKSLEICLVFSRFPPNPFSCRRFPCLQMKFLPSEGFLSVMPFYIYFGGNPVGLKQNRRSVR